MKNGDDSTMEDAIQIRPATLTDAGVIADFNERMAQETEGKRLSRERLRLGVQAGLSNSSLARYFLACRADNIVGQLMLTTEWSDWRNGQIWWIQSVYVRPEERRRGVYRALHEHVRSLAQQTPGVVCLRLYVARDNAVAQDTYRGLGMTDAGYVVFEQMLEGGHPGNKS